MMLFNEIYNVELESMLYDVHLVVAGQVKLFDGVLSVKLLVA